MVQEVVNLGERQESGLAQYVVPVSEEQEYGVAKHAVHIEHAQGVGVIGIGPITGSITRAWIEYGGEEVTEVPEGENFNVFVHYTAENPGFPADIFDLCWSLTLTAIDTTDWELKKHHGGMQITETPHSSDIGVTLGPMPNHDISIRLRLWGMQDDFTLPWIPSYPPEAEW